MAWADKKAQREYNLRYMPQYRKRNAARLNARISKWERKNYKARMLIHAKARAKKIGVAFSITAQDVVWPKVCPALGLRLRYRTKKLRVKRTAHAASLDRIDPKKGYVPGNVQVLSLRANMIKQNATADEILRVGAHCKRMESRK